MVHVIPANLRSVQKIEYHNSPTEQFVEKAGTIATEASLGAPSHGVNERTTLI